MLHLKHDLNSNASMSSISLNSSKFLSKSSELSTLSFTVISAARKLKGIHIVFGSMIQIVASMPGNRFWGTSPSIDLAYHTGYGAYSELVERRDLFVIYAYMLFRRCTISRSTKHRVFWNWKRMVHSVQYRSQSQEVSLMYSYHRRWRHSAWVPDVWEPLVVPWPYHDYKSRPAVWISTKYI